MKSIFTITFGLLFGLCLMAQTVNTGELTISEGSIFSTLHDFNNTVDGEVINNGDVYVYGDWNNDGMVDFDPSNEGTSNGLTRFIANSNQRISGSEFSSFNNVLFNNSSLQPAIELEGLISVSTEADYTLGIVNNDNFGGTFLFEQNGIDVNTSDDSHVDGPVIKEGSQDFVFPIGDGGFYRPASITAPNANTDSFTSQYFFEPTNNNFPTANLSGSIVLVDANEYWTIERTTGNSEVVITLSWRDVTTPSEITATPTEDITIAYWDSTLRVWEELPSVVDDVNQTVTTVAVVENYGVFTLARKSNSGIPCGLSVVNRVITPGADDTINAFFELDYPATSTCIDNVNVQVYNRWGVKVYESDNYGLNGNVFSGFSDGRLTISKNNRLPTGTYFYIIEMLYNDPTSGNKSVYKEADYLYLQGD